MQLVADRFVVADDGLALDLASGAPVELAISPAGGISDQRRWCVRCDLLRQVQHRAIAPLLDFGALGESSRFEAWQCQGGADSSGSRETTVRAAQAWLRAVGLSLGEPRVGRDAEGALVVLPGVDTGYPAETDYPREAMLSLQQHALALIDRPALKGLSEMLHTGPETRPRVAAAWGPAGAGKSTLARTLARIARVNGFVPVSASLVDTRMAALWEGRSLFIVADETRASGWPALVNAVLKSPRSHVLLLLGSTEVRGVDGVSLGPVCLDTLIEAVRPHLLEGNLRVAARQAAERAAGLPGRFAQVFRPAGLSVRGGVSRAPKVPRVAEQPATYGTEVRADARAHLAVAVRAHGGAWPAPGELSALRRRVTGASGLLARGRHSPAIRHLRQAVGALARRDAWIDASEGSMLLASALLRRGRVKDAQAALEETREFAGRAGCGSLLLDIARLSADAWIDAARLDEAENVAAAALASARAAGDDMRTRSLSLVLARCLWWRGRWADAAVTLGDVAADAVIDTRVRHLALAARIAVGLRDVPRAMALVNEALDCTREADSPRARAAAHGAAAFVHLAVDDFEAVDQHGRRAVAEARGAHDPLGAVRGRLLLAEVERRRGRRGRALAVIARIRRLESCVPATVRALASLVASLALATGDHRRAVARAVSASGLPALELFAPRSTAAASAKGLDQEVEDLVAVLRLCQTAEDEATVLKAVCAKVRRQTHAASVSFVAATPRGATVIEGDGPRLDSDLAARAIDAGIVIAPHQRGERVEAAAPVQYGGRAIAALCARWALGNTRDLSRSPLLLTMGATAAAPLVSAVLARREQTPAAGVGVIVGVTSLVRDLRATVERVAAAPFPVLVDGESGSGKELVARALHRVGPRRDKTFCTLNCAALPDDLIEAELFGHARGAFTGAIADRAGVFEEAHGGTLFLDEIGELSPRAQAKLLRVLQEGELRRVGESVSRRVDARVVAATNRDLHQEAAAGKFRLDLLYRLDVIRLTVPPLRDRREDIPVLAEHFWRECTARVGSRATLAAATLGALARYDWPGNVRELQNVLAALVVRSPRRGVVPPEALPPHIGERGVDEMFRLNEARRMFEAGFVRAALARTGGRRARAAEELGVSRQGLTKLMTRLGIA